MTQMARIKSRASGWWIASNPARSVKRRGSQRAGAGRSPALGNGTAFRRNAARGRRYRARRRVRTSGGREGSSGRDGRPPARRVAACELDLLLDDLAEQHAARVGAGIAADSSSATMMV
jgi:hypothetical protein